MRGRLLIIVLFCLMGCVLLSGCGVLNVLPSDDLVAYDQMQYSRPDMVAFHSVLDESCQKALEEKNLKKVVDSIYDFYRVYDDFYTNLNLAFIAYSRDLTDLYWEAEYGYCTSYSATADAGLDRLYRSLAQSPVRQELEGEDYFGADYFDSYEGESIYDEHLMSLLEKEAQLQGKYQTINGEASNETYYSDAYFTQYGQQMAQVYVELVQLRQQIAAYVGYDSYVDFAYDYYYVRDYTPAQATAYLADIQAELTPLYKMLGRSDLAVELESADESQTFAYVCSMAKTMGGTINRAFTQMEKHKLYDITYSEKKYNTSFETYLPSYYTPYVFLCPTGTAYDQLTFAHEFGHFCCDYVTDGGSVQGVDVSEIFSQAMEYLSLCYAENVGDLKKIKMADCLSVYVEQAAYASFEQQVYSLNAEELTCQGVQDLYENVMRAYGLDQNGWDSRDYVCVPHFYESPLYIISYVLSNDAALQIYELEQQEQGKGLQCYVSSMTSAQPYILAFLEEAGLQSPFATGRLVQVKETLQKAIF